MKKKICFITDSVYSLGGIQRVVTDLANSLCQYHKIDIICLNRVNENNRVNYGLKDNIKIIELFNTKKEDYVMLPLRVLNVIFEKVKFPKNYKKIQLRISLKRFYFRNKRIIKLINREKYDFVVATGLNNCIMLTQAKKKINDKICLIGWWHSSYKNYVESGDYPKKCITASLKCLDKIIVLTKNDQKLIKDNFNIEVLQLYNPLSIFEETGSEDKIKYKRIIAVGRYNRVKQFDKAIQSFEKFLNIINDKQWKLDIIGEGEEHKYLSSIIEKNNLNNCVNLYGKTNDIFDEYKKSSIMMITSISEGLPTVVLEAMKFGIPVVGFQIPVLQEILPLSDITLVEQGDTDGLAITIMNLIENNELQKKIKLEYRKKIKEFDIKTITNEWNNQIIK